MEQKVVHERVFEWLCKYDGLEEIKKQSQEHLKDNSKVCKRYSCSSIEAIVQFSDYFRSHGGFCHQLRQLNLRLTYILAINMQLIAQRLKLN
jgi:hypothetical protein